MKKFCLILLCLILILLATPVLKKKTYISQVDTANKVLNYYTFKQNDEYARKITKKFQEHLNNYHVPVTSTFDEFSLDNNDIKILLQNGDYLRVSQKYTSTGYNFDSYTFPEYHKD